VIDYTKEDFTTGTCRYDVVFDNVSNRSLADVRRVVKPNGTIIPNGGGSPEKGISILGLLGTVVKRSFISQRIVFGVTKPNATDLQTLAGMIEAGTIRPVIDRCYPMPRWPRPSATSRPAMRTARSWYRPARMEG
jgi:NADPH:quinone reductase-like Zn-dependent oxidoreductase